MLSRLVCRLFGHRPTKVPRDDDIAVESFEVNEQWRARCADQLTVTA